MQNLSPTHPRLFLNQKGEADLKAKIARNPSLQPLADRIVETAAEFLTLPPVERELEGRRLLDVSRTALSRITHLSMAYRLTGEEKYARRAIQEMTAAAGFSDWNPSHFLDTAEMTAALGLGYDWCYSAMSPEERDLIAHAILEKGLRSSLPDPETGEHPGYTKSHHNWNQVCNGGLAVGALAVAERDPALAMMIIDRAVKYLPEVIKTYAPDGAYVEGPMYWTYGTTFNVMFLDAVETALGTDFGLGSMPGFLESADFMQHITGPSGLYFNFADCSEKASLQPALFWMARRWEQPSLLWSQWQFLQATGSTQRSRFMPFLLIWAPEETQKEKPSLTHWHGDGSMPVAFHRSHWGADATYVAIKGGSPKLNHAHMDVGSFVLEMNGVRWAYDLGKVNYHHVEREGIQLWNSAQDAERWKIFRLGSFSHNIFTVNGQQQRVEGEAPILSSTPAPEHKTVVDLSELYLGQLDEALRSIRLIDPNHVLLEDRVKTPAKPTRIRWGMVTRAKVERLNPQVVSLKQNGQMLLARIEGLAHAEWQVQNISKPIHDWEPENPGASMLIFEADLPEDSESVWQVHFQEAR